MLEKASKPSVGFIGLGNMGLPMARNLLKKGFPLTVYDISSDRSAVLAREGARVAQSPTDLAGRCDIICCSLPEPKVSREVIAGESGIAAGLRPGSIVVELSTVPPSLIREMCQVVERRGGWLLDAGVAGGVPNAEKGTLTIMVGGDRLAYERASAALQAIGSNIFYMGPSGHGMIAKIVNNAIAHVNVVAAVEGMALGVKAGLSPDLLAEVLSKGSANSYQFENRVKGRLLKRNFKPGMKLHLAYKDSRLACELGNELGVPLFVTGVAHSVYQEGMSAGWADEDYVTIAKIWEKLLGISIESGDK
ncbi:MAG TPA: NAD(P)-dependent oxidoreductase [Clostridia bacterium]|nr:NAD(P)-dependent oxidoreductase [Clostridia bacterium]